MAVKHVLSSGAGVQSTTILLMSLEGVLPRLDHVIFADTQWEPSAVYRHLEWCQEHAAKHGLTIDLQGMAHALVGVQGAATGTAAEEIQPGDAFVRVAGDFRTLAAALDWAEIGP